MRTSGSRRVVWIGVGLLLAFAFAEVAARITMTTTTEAIRWYDEAAQLKIEQMDDLDDVDVVFAGTSMAWQAFVPSVFDDATRSTSYNAGLNGGTPEVMERWLLEEVIPRTHPTTVVWGLSSLDLAPNYGGQQREVYDEALATRTGLLAAIEQAAAGWSTLVANRTVLRSLNDLYGNGADLRETALAEADERLGENGERRDFRTDTNERQRQIMQARLRGFAPDATDIATISQVIRTLQADDIEVVLVQLPVPQGFIDAHPRGQEDYAFVEVTLDALASTTGSRFLDMTESHPDNQFIDLSHLDEISAAAFTTRFAAALQSTRDDRGTTTPPPPPDATTAGRDDCTTETIIDDYGFEIEIANCPREPKRTNTEPAPPQPALDAAISDRDRRCSAGESPTSALLAIAEAIDEASERLAGDERDTISITYELIQEAVLDSGTCAQATADPAVSAATAAITGALDRMYALLEFPAQRSSAIFGHRDRITTSLWIRDMIESGTGLDGLIIGNSISRTGIDPVQLGKATGTTIGQASVGGMSPETMGPWIDEILEQADPDTVYMALTYYDLYALCRVEDRNLASRTLADLRAEAFAGIIDEAARARWNQFFGADGFGAYGDSAILRSIQLDDVIPSRGRDPLLDPEPRADLLQRHRDDVGVTWFPGEPCSDRTPHIADLVGRLQDSGREVVIFVVPPNPVFADDNTGGIPGYFDDAAALTVGVDADLYIPLEIRIDPSRFKDGVHFLADGRTELTRALGDALVALTPPG